MALFIQVPGDERRPKLYIKRQNILDRYTDNDLYKRFRFDRAGIEYICDLVRANIASNSERGMPIPIATQVLAFLQYAAGNSFQLHIADSLGISQKSLSNCINRVATSLADQADQFIHFPENADEIRQAKAAFSNRGFPGIIGLIDCTHIHIRAPNLAVERDYVNRKGRHSINVQAIVGESGKFLNLSASWPGCTHDSFILQNSNVYPAFENREIDGILLGDSGYPNKRWLLTPFRNPITPAQQRYNNVHSKVRVGIEQVFGRFKRRFHSLHEELRLGLEHVPNFIIACAVLQNIAIDRKLPDFMACNCGRCLERRRRNNGNDDAEDMPEVAYENLANPRMTNNAFRQQIVDNYFTR